MMASAALQHSEFWGSMAAFLHVTNIGGGGEGKAGEEDTGHCG